MHLFIFIKKKQIRFSYDIRREIFWKTFNQNFYNLWFFLTNDRKQTFSNIFKNESIHFKIIISYQIKSICNEKLWKNSWSIEKRIKKCWSNFYFVKCLIQLTKNHLFKYDNILSEFQFSISKKIYRFCFVKYLSWKKKC